jgi:hypothetical protein
MNWVTFSGNTYRASQLPFGVLLPVHEVWRGLDPERMAADCRAAVRRRAQPHDLRTEPDRSVVLVSRDMLEIDKDGHLLPLACAINRLFEANFGPSPKTRAGVPYFSLRTAPSGGLGGTIAPTGRRLPGKPGSDSQAAIQFQIGGANDNGTNDRVIRIEMVTRSGYKLRSNANFAELHVAGAGEVLEWSKVAAHRGEYGKCEPPDPVLMTCRNPRSATHPRMERPGRQAG